MFDLVFELYDVMKERFDEYVAVDADGAGSSDPSGEESNDEKAGTGDEGKASRASVLKTTVPLKMLPTTAAGWVLDICARIDKRELAMSISEYVSTRGFSILG